MQIAGLRIPDAVAVPPVVIGAGPVDHLGEEGLVGCRRVQLVGRPEQQRWLGQRHLRTEIAGALFLQPPLVRGRQVASVGQHPGVVDDVGQLAVRSLRLGDQTDLVARQFGMAVPQPERDEVGIPLPGADIAEQRRHHRQPLRVRPQPHRVQPQRAPAQPSRGGEAFVDDRAAGVPVGPAGRLGRGGLDMPAEVDRARATADVPAPGARSRIRLPSLAVRVAPGQCPGAGDADPGVVDGDLGRTAAPQPGEEHRLGQRPLVLGGVCGEIVGAGDDEDPRTDRRERQRGRSRCGHLPPSPEDAIEFRICRWATMNTISIGMVDSADAAMISP